MLTKEEATGEARAHPIRTCIGCRRRTHAAELVRVRRRPDGSLDLGPGPGRGAWLCGSPSTVDCFEAAIRRTALTRALRAEIADDEIEKMRARLGQ